MIVHRYGDTALLAEVEDSGQAVWLRSEIERRAPTGVLETMPGLRTVLVRFDPVVTDAGRLTAALHELRPERAPRPASSPASVAAAVRGLRVDYSGPDLDEVARQVGMDREVVIAAHQAATYRVVLIGMAPGFYFLAGGDPRLWVRRRPDPRVEVPKGALGLAGDYTGIYPRRGPGGWQLIGWVLEELWHPSRLPAAELAPGAVVRFTAA